MVDHSDQVEADQAHAQHPLPLLDEEGENRNKDREEGDENKNNDNKGKVEHKVKANQLLERDGEIEEEKRRKEDNANTVESCTAKE